MKPDLYGTDYIPSVTPQGRKILVYRGQWYRFAVVPDRWQLLTGALLTGLLLLPLLLGGGQLSRTVYVALPAVLTLAPLGRLVAGALTLKPRSPMTRRQRDRLLQLQGACLWAAILPGIACAGTWLRGFAPAEAFQTLCLHLTAVPLALLLHQRPKLAAY